MNKSRRLFEIMQALRRRRYPVAGLELAREAGVSLRTIRRDVAALQSMGADIAGEAGVGYVLKPGFLLPPLMFSEEELQAVTLGMKWVRSQTDQSMALAAANALAKIDAVLPGELRYLVEDDGFHVSERSGAHARVDLDSLVKAMRGQYKICVRYRDAGGHETERVLWPVAIGFVEEQRFVAAWCELRQDFRTFRLDRVGSLATLDERYPGKRRDLVKRWRQIVDSKVDAYAATSTAEDGDEALHILGLSSDA